MMQATCPLVDLIRTADLLTAQGPHSHYVWRRKDNTMFVAPMDDILKQDVQCVYFGQYDSFWHERREVAG